LGNRSFTKSSQFTKKMIEIDEKCINELNEENKNLKKSQCNECLICKNM